MNGIPLGRPTVIYHCPFCAEENLRPAEEAFDAWFCTSCLRTFSVRLLSAKAVTR